MDELVVVGGLVPSLLINQGNLPEGAEAHAGTSDLDVGLTVALLNEGRYTTLSDRLRRAGFSPDVNEGGNPTRQRWKIEEGGAKVTVDFLIQPSLPGDRGGNLRDLEAGFAAIIAPGLELAFLDRRHVNLSGETIMGETASRDIWVCGVGAYIVLKALAFDRRGENKDAYDLYYVVRNYGTGVDDVAAGLHPPSPLILFGSHARGGAEASFARPCARARSSKTSRETLKQSAEPSTYTRTRRPSVIGRSRPPARVPFG